MRSRHWCWLCLATSTPLVACDEATLSVLPLGSSVMAGAGQSGGSLAGAGTGGGGAGAGARPEAGSSDLGGEDLGGAAATPGLVGHWPLDTDASDPLGLNDGTLKGGVAFVSDAIRGQVLECDGTNGYVAVANHTTNDFSYAMWMWSETPSPQGSDSLDGAALLHSNTVGEVDDFLLTVLNEKLRYLSYNNKATGTGNVVDGVWHHVAVTRSDGAEVTLFLDGAVDGDGQSGTGPVLDNPEVHVCGNPVNGRYFGGRIDDLRQYDRVLSPDEVRGLYLATRLP